MAEFLSTHSLVLGLFTSGVLRSLARDYDCMPPGALVSNVHWKKTRERRAAEFYSLSRTSDKTSFPKQRLGQQAPNC